MPRPWVKWAYQPARAQDVPAAFMRAYAIAVQPPAGPVFLSIPLDDWDKPALGPAVVRTVSHRVSPDTHRLRSSQRQATIPSASPERNYRICKRKLISRCDTTRVTA